MTLSHDSDDTSGSGVPISTIRHPADQEAVEKSSKSTTGRKTVRKATKTHAYKRRRRGSTLDSMTIR